MRGDPQVLRVQEHRTLLQALLVRLYPRNLRLMSDGERLAARRLAGSSDSLSVKERRLIRENSEELATMLDPRLSHRLVLDVRRQLADSYPLARGVDISTAQTLVEEAIAKLGNGDVHGCWYLLDRALHLGLRLCQEGYKSPILERGG